MGGSLNRTFELSEDEIDAVSEILNIGVGQAARALSEMVDEPVTLSVPYVVLLPVAQTWQELEKRTKGNACAIKERFGGSFSGDALLVFPEQDSLELVRKLLAEETEITVFTELEQDALIEVGNVILTSCISAFADTLGVEIEYSDLPVMVRGSKGEDLLSSANGDQDYNLFMEVDFKLDQDNISGIVLIALSLKSAVDLQTKLQEYLPTLEI